MSKVYLKNIEDRRVRAVVKELPIGVCSCFDRAPLSDGHDVVPACESVRLALRIVKGQRKLDANPKVGNKIPYTVIENDIAVRVLVEEFEPCNEFETIGAIALLQSGMEERGMHAMERAHIVLVAVGLVSEDDPFGDGADY